MGFDQYKCDCTRTGFYGENCSTRKSAARTPRAWHCVCHRASLNHTLLSAPLLAAEFLTRIKLLLKPTPNTVHYILTHFKAVWNIVNNIPFLRNSIMRYVLTCKCQALATGVSRETKTCLTIDKPDPA